LDLTYEDQFAQMQFCAEKNGWTKFISMQNHYSLCYREEEREMNRFCAEMGVGLIPWAPLYDGELARAPSTELTKRAQFDYQVKVITESDKEIVKRVEHLAIEKSWKMAQVALAWIIQKGTVPIVGISSLARLDEACDLKDKRLTDAEIAHLEEPYVSKAIVGHS
jgi:aryl-alcohol dehydrogenase-like predicted oxidoreductase